MSKIEIVKKFDKNNFLIILISPSGGGKSVILSEIVRKNSNIEYSISYTTRNIRDTETNGESYHFVSEEKFLKMNAEGDFLESAKVHGNYYGTSKKLIRKILSKQKNVIMDIDIQGAKQIMNQDIDFVTIFILPPSKKIWLERLKKRGTENAEIIKTRLATAETELAEIDKFQYLVINDVLSEAVNDVENIIFSEERKIDRYKNIIKDFNKELKKNEPQN